MPFSLDFQTQYRVVPPEDFASGGGKSGGKNNKKRCSQHAFRPHFSGTSPFFSDEKSRYVCRAKNKREFPVFHILRRTGNRKAGKIRATGKTTCGIILNCPSSHPKRRRASKYRGGGGQKQKNFRDRALLFAKKRVCQFDFSTFHWLRKVIPHPKSSG